MTPGTEAEVTDDYFLGDKKMSTFAVSMSLVASFISALTTLGYPPEGEFMIMMTMMMMMMMMMMMILPWWNGGNDNDNADKDVMIMMTMTMMIMIYDDNDDDKDNEMIKMIKIGRWK